MIILWFVLGSFMVNNLELTKITFEKVWSEESLMQRGTIHLSLDMEYKKQRLDLSLMT